MVKYSLYIIGYKKYMRYIINDIYSMLTVNKLKSFIESLVLTNRDVSNIAHTSAD